jgi:hypothetical protein
VKDLDIDSFRKELEKEGLEVLKQVEPPGTKGRASAIYVEDPFRYVIELKEQA